MKTTLLLITILSMILSGCNTDLSSQYTYQPPENLNDGFVIGTPEETNIDIHRIGTAVDQIRQGKYREVHSLLIYKSGKLIVEEYFPGHDYKWDAPAYFGEWINWDSHHMHHLQSVTKSITSTCIGIAIDKGYIQNINQSIFDYLPEHQQYKTGGKENITIEYLVTMTSGLQWDEWHASLSSAENDIIGVFFSEKDPVSFILQRPLIHEPGTTFTYSGGGMILLGEIIRNATGMDINEFSGKYLFEPLGIDSYDWWNQFSNGVYESAGCLRMTPRSMAKIGVTFLNQGTWDGKRIIAENWENKSAVPYNNNKKIRIPGEDLGNTGYGYTWWTKEFMNSGRKINMYWGNGWGGQKIVVIPDLDAVIVLTGGTFTSRVKSFKLLRKYLIPAISNSNRRI